MGLGPQGCVSGVQSLVAVDSVSIDCTRVTQNVPSGLKLAEVSIFGMQASVGHAAHAAHMVEQSKSWVHRCAVPECSPQLIRHLVSQGTAGQKLSCLMHVHTGNLRR